MHWLLLLGVASTWLVAVYNTIQYNTIQYNTTCCCSRERVLRWALLSHELLFKRARGTYTKYTKYATYADHTPGALPPANRVLRHVCAGVRTGDEDLSDLIESGLLTQVNMPPWCRSTMISIHVQTIYFEPFETSESP